MFIEIPVWHERSIDADPGTCPKRTNQTWIDPFESEGEEEEEEEAG